jgi:16S rRNA (cytidine1402-2'-O)-methyltransferase
MASLMTNEEFGILYVVATPIGNLQDITLRALEILKQVDRIATEDTRHSGPLLKHYSIEKPTLSLHDYNERDRLGVILDYLYEGESIALISDAGTPLISDPGFHLVRAVRAEGIRVVPVPGPCAAIAALSAAGLPTDRFVFEGFLSPKTEACRKQLMRLLHETRTMIFYEAPHRLLPLLTLMIDVFGSARKAVIARELTKTFESIITTTLGELLDYYTKHEKQLRGEIVLLVHGVDEEKSESREVVPEKVLDILLEEMPVKQAASLASRITGARKNELYELALTKKK